MWVRRLRDLLVDGFPECVEEDAWVGVRWRVGQATIAHAFGGEDGLFRITFRAEADEVMAFQHLGRPYFKAGWGVKSSESFSTTTPTGRSWPSC